MKIIKQLSILFGVVLTSFAISTPSIMAQLSEESEQPMEQQNTQPVGDLVEETFKRAREYDRRMEIEKAIAEYTKVIEMQPDHLDAYFYRSTDLIYVDPEKAIEDARKVQELHEQEGNQAAADSMEVHIEDIRSGAERGDFDKMPEPIPELNKELFQ